MPVLGMRITENSETDSKANNAQRSWLQVADDAKKLQQTQLRLVIDNIPLPVSTHTTVYEAVIEAWSNALVALERLIKGIPQSIQNGAVLLGLSSWHIYPDLSVAESNQQVFQRDSLVEPGGIVTIGLQGKHDDSQGLFWSLPLAHARYYGDPVMIKRHAGVGDSRVAFEDFLFVSLGAILGGWKLPSSRLDAGLELIYNFAATVKRPREGIEWLRTLANAIELYTKSRDVRRQEITQLLLFGQRRSREFLDPNTDKIAPFFGLTDFTCLATSFSNYSSGFVYFLKMWALKNLKASKAKHAVIRYHTTSYSRAQYTTVLDNESSQKQIIPRSSTQQVQQVNPLNDPLTWEDPEDYFTSDMPTIGVPGRLGSKWEDYSIVCGEPCIAAVYLPSRIREERQTQMAVGQLIDCLERGEIELSHLAESFAAVYFKFEGSTYFRSLEAIDTARHVFDKLPGAKVDLRVTLASLSGAKWWQSTRYEYNHRLGLSATLSCIAYFETGGLDIDPISIGRDTFALSHNASLFVASNLLRDPGEDDTGPLVEVLFGNVGRPGLAFLISPPDPRIADVNFADWNLVTHAPFDGSLMDGFDKTTFHLSFTGYELPIDIDRRSNRDAPAYFLETAISIYDRGRWIGDINNSRSWGDIIKISGTGCHHSASQKADISCLPSFIAVDAWQELLDPPAESFMIRAFNNPIGRLATALIAARAVECVLILPRKDPCWACLRRNIHELGDSDVIGTSTEGSVDATEDWSSDHDEEQSETHDEDSVKGLDCQFAQRDDRERDSYASDFQMSEESEELDIDMEAMMLQIGRIAVVY